MTGRRSERASADEGKAGAGRMGGDVAQGEDGEGEGQDEGEGAEGGAEELVVALIWVATMVVGRGVFSGGHFSRRRGRWRGG